MEREAPRHFFVKVWFQTPLHAAVLPLCCCAAPAELYYQVGQCCGFRGNTLLCIHLFALSWQDIDWWPTSIYIVVRGRRWQWRCSGDATPTGAGAALLPRHCCVARNVISYKIMKTTYVGTCSAAAALLCAVQFEFIP